LLLIIFLIGNEINNFYNYIDSDDIGPMPEAPGTKKKQRGISY